MLYEMSNVDHRPAEKHCGHCKKAMPISSPGHSKCAEYLLECGAERALLFQDLARSGYVRKARPPHKSSVSNKIRSIFGKRI